MVRHQNLLVIVAILLLAAVILTARLQRNHQNIRQTFPVARTDKSITIVYGPRFTNGANLLDLYLPIKSVDDAHGIVKPCPLVIFIHGGAWQSGDKFMMPDPKEFHKRGYAIASLNYRLTSEAPYPAQIEDCKTAVSWLREHATIFKIDPNRIGIWGISAGGHLAALLGTTGDMTTPSWARSASGVSNRVQAVCDWCGPTDLTTMSKQAGSTYVLDKAVDRLLSSGTKEKSVLAKEASAISYVNKNCPPFLIMHGNHDNIVPVAQSIELARALKLAGVKCTLTIMPGISHMFASQATTEQVLQFFDQNLKSEFNKPVQSSPLQAQVSSH
jgi:acetyl esterase/lipase